MIDFQHPGEQSAWNALTKNAVFQTAVDVFQSIYTDLTAFAAMKGRNFLVTEQTYPKLFAIYRLAAARLGVTEPVPIYIQMEYGIQIQTVGTDGDCAILLNSACLEECTDEQLLALFGQELAHIRYRHLRMLNLNSMLDTVLGMIPFGAAAGQVFKTLLLQWRQYAYYTADRGAAIAARGKAPVLQNLSQAMGRKLDSEGVEATLALLQEDDESQADQSVAAKAVLQLMMNSIAVPFGVWRMRELQAWQVSANELRCLADPLPGSDASEASRKTVEALDIAAKGIYRGAVKAAGVVRTGTEEMGAYISENHPEWVESYGQVKAKAADAVRTGMESASAYITEKRPEWEKNLAQAKEGYKELSKGVKAFLKRKDQ